MFNDVLNRESAMERVGMGEERVRGREIIILFWTL